MIKPLLKEGCAKPWTPPRASLASHRFFSGLGADDAQLRHTMARFHTDLAEESRTEAGIADQAINDLGHQSLSHLRAAVQAAEAAAQARQQAAEVVGGPQRHRAQADQHLAQADQYDRQAQTQGFMADQAAQRAQEQPERAQARLDRSLANRASARRFQDRAQESRDKAQQELDQADRIEAAAPAAARAQAQKFRAQADELDTRSKQLGEQARHVRSQVRGLLTEKNSADVQHDQSQQRAQTYQGRGASRVVYDHGGIEAGVAELQQVAARAQAHLEAGRQARFRLQQGAAGALADAAQDALLQLEQVNRRIIGATRNALRDLGVANRDMADLDAHIATLYH